MEFAESLQDNALEFADKIIEKTGFWGLVPAVMTVLTGTITSIGLLILDIPLVLNEVITKSVANELINSNFDKAFVAEAQRQILLIKICEYISTEQLRL